MHNAVQSCEYFLPVWDLIGGKKKNKNKKTLSKIFVDILLSNHGRLSLLYISFQVYQRFIPARIR